MAPVTVGILVGLIVIALVLLARRSGSQFQRELEALGGQRDSALFWGLDPDARLMGTLVRVTGAMVWVARDGVLVMNRRRPLTIPYDAIVDASLDSAELLGAAFPGPKVAGGFVDSMEKQSYLHLEFEEGSTARVLRLIMMNDDADRCARLIVEEYRRRRGYPQAVELTDPADT